MADYGVTTTGFVPKRLEDILNEQRVVAQQIFQDKVAPNDVVDVSDSSLLGRLINLKSVGDAFTWELGQAVYSAFDPNTASGIALDNLVAYGNLSRLKASQSTALVMFYGDVGTVVPIDSVVSDTVTGKKFNVAASVTINLTKSSKIVIEVATVTNSATYSLQYANSGGNYSTVTYTADSATSETEILNGLMTSLSGHPNLVATLDLTAGTIAIERSVILQNTDWIVSDNLTATKAGKISLVRCSDYGDNDQATNTLTKIDTPVIGWDSASNVLPATVGRYTETDEELRLRFRNTKFTRSINILDSLYSDLVNVEGVTNVRVYENDTDEDVNIADIGTYLLEDHSFLAVVLGGSPSDIADTIWKNKPTGVQSVGNTLQTVYDSQGFPHSIRYEIPNPTAVYVTMELETDALLFPADGAAQIKQAILDYAAENFSVGDDVAASRLYTPINSIAGHEVNYLYIGTAPSPSGSTTIPIEFNRIASFDPANIIINIV